VWSYALELADGLAALGASVTLALTGERPRADQQAELRHSSLAACHVADFKLEWMPRAERDVERTCSWLLDLEDSVRPDVIHLNAYAYGAAPFRAPVVTVAHSCVLSWFEAVRNQPAPGDWDGYRALVATGLRGADLVVAPTQSMLDALTRHHPVAAETQVIANGVGAAGRPCRKADVVLAAGRLWDEAKNVAALARVAPRLDWPVEVAGEGSVPEGGHVRALGRLSRSVLRERMAQRRVFCAPALYEPFGLAPLEAAAAGCALVLGDIPSLREVWEDAALYAPAGDDDALVDAIGRAMRRPELGQRARRRSQELTRDRMAAAYLDAYERVSARALDDANLHAHA
jgi:glycosyltransferase involved in cell wall biosynthesis